MLKAKDLVEPIEAFAPVELQESWDNCGFSVGDPQKRVKGVLIALDCTEEVLDEAIGLGCDMIITNGANPEKIYDIMDGKSVGTKFFAEKK